MDDPVYGKLSNVLGEVRARRLFDDTLAELGLDRIRNADDRLRFGAALLKHGGVVEAIGRAIKVQAILQGAKEA